MKMLDEFKQFALRGNVVDMAVGIIIGAGFGKIVDSVVKDIIMPPIGLIVGGIDFNNLQWVLKAAENTSPVVSIKYGSFINTTISFTIIAFATFLLIKGINTLKKKEAIKPSIPAVPTTQEVLLTEIRDLLKKK